MLVCRRVAKVFASRRFRLADCRSTDQPYEGQTHTTIHVSVQFLDSPTEAHLEGCEGIEYCHNYVFLEERKQMKTNLKHGFHVLRRSGEQELFANCTLGKLKSLHASHRKRKTCSTGDEFVSESKNVAVESSTYSESSGQEIEFFIGNERNNFK